MRWRFVKSIGSLEEAVHVLTDIKSIEGILVLRNFHVVIPFIKVPRPETLNLNPKHF